MTTMNTYEECTHFSPLSFFFLVMADESCVLDSPTCYKIIQGTCDGLNHLHSAQPKPIFHMDLTPSNILLDKDMTPKITDFSLSTLVASTEEEYQSDRMIGTP
uniref:Protein kinase domain-containing protein n=1 Tax=Aegilops tauschii subsp. strangulata TaxID=200361 RepID=A0A453A9V5_AEGTS